MLVLPFSGMTDSSVSTNFTVVRVGFSMSSPALSYTLLVAQFLPTCQSRIVFESM